MPKKQVAAYIAKQSPEHQQILKKLRKLILATFPGCKEEFKWGVPVYDGGRFYLASLKKQVNLGFAITGLSKAEVAQFAGSGKTMRHLKIHSLDFDKAKIIKLLKLVKKKASCSGC